MARKKRVAPAAIGRLSTYSRVLNELEREGVEITSSGELAPRAGCGASQIRKDLACFGEFGSVGRGYHVRELKEAISQILGVDQTWNVALVGAGNLGSALLHYPGFREHGFKIVAVFDNDLGKTGRELEDAVLHDMSEMSEKIKEYNVRMGIIAVPAKVAQHVADMLVLGGIRAILNFAPTKIVVPQGVQLRTADLSKELEQLSYFLTDETSARTQTLGKGRITGRDGG